MTDTYDYDTFGNIVNSTGTTANNYLYRGEFFNPDLTLYYLRARYFNPFTGSFLTKDPFAGEISDPATLHKYIYAGNDRINLSDPTGLLQLAPPGPVAPSAPPQTQSSGAGGGGSIIEYAPYHFLYCWR